MIDIENDVFTIVANKLRNAFPGIFVAGEYTETPASFPAVNIVEADNSVATRYRTTQIEDAVRIMYEINVYSSKSNAKKSEAKSIVAVADKAMKDMGFTRTIKQQIPNLNDASIYRIVCRYEGVVIPNDDGKYYIHSY